MREIHSPVLDVDTWKLTSFYVALNGYTTKKEGFTSPFLGRVMVCLPVTTVKTIKDTPIAGSQMRISANGFRIIHKPPCNNYPV